MPFTWQISIYKTPEGGVMYEPAALDQVKVGDQIVWSNKDDDPHWPGLKKDDGSINPTYFMPNQIAPYSPSDTFIPGVAGTVTYVDSLEPTGPTGTIAVTT